MNLSYLISRIKKELGIYTIALPIDNIDKFLAETIKGITLRDYSQFFPKYENVTIPGKEIQKAERERPSTEYIEIRMDVATKSEIISIDDVRPNLDTAYGFGYYASGMPLYGAASLGDLLTTHIGAELSNLMVPKINWNFEYPNILQLYNLYYYTGDLNCVCKLLHDPSLVTIPFSQEESFTEVAIIDCKKVLYEVVKHYNEMESAHGRINLRIDDWTDARTERKEIINQWRDSFHLDQGYPRWA